MERKLCMNVVIFCVILYSVTCEANFENTLIEKDTIPASKVNEYVKNIVSELFQKQEYEIDELKDRVRAQEAKIAELEKDKLSYQNVVSKLEMRVTLLETKGGNKHSANGNEVHKDESEKNIEPTMERHSNKAVKTLNKNAKPEFVRRVRRAVESGVAFSAYMTPNPLNVGEKQDLVFDHVVTNIGSGYNNHHGTFIAPVAGTYVFYFSLHSPGARADLVVNGSVVSNLYISNDQASQLAIVNLKVGDDVAVQNIAADKVYWGAGYSTFSGFLLYDHLGSASVIG